MLQRTFRISTISLGFVGLAACGGGTTTPAPQHATAPAAEKADAKEAGAGPSALVAAPIQKVEDALPTKVTSLFQFVGKDTPIIVNIPRLDKVVAALDTAAEDQLPVDTELAELVDHDTGIGQHRILEQGP